MELANNRSADRSGIADEMLRILSLNWDRFTCFPGQRITRYHTDYLAPSSLPVLMRSRVYFNSLPFSPLPSPLSPLLILSTRQPTNILNILNIPPWLFDKRSSLFNPSQHDPLSITFSRLINLQFHPYRQEHRSCIPQPSLPP